MEHRFQTFTTLINRISRNIRKIKNQEMAEYNLRSIHVSCLYYLYIKTNLTSSELCVLCEEDKAAISRTLEYLKVNDYIEYENKSGKRYKSLIGLTPKGLKVGKEIVDKIKKVLDDISGELNEQQRVDFYESLTLISNRLEERAN